MLTHEMALLAKPLVPTNVQREKSGVVAGKNLPSAGTSGTNAGNAIADGLDPSQGGLLGGNRVQMVNSAKDAAMTKSAEIDQLYEDGQLTREDWLKLKAAMTASMMNGLGQGSGNTPAKVEPARSSTSVKTPSENLGPTSDSGYSSIPEVAVDQSVVGDRRRTLASIPESDPNEVGAGAQVLSLNNAGPLVVGNTLTPDTVSKDTSPGSADSKSLQMNESAKPGSKPATAGSPAQLVIGSSLDKTDREESHEKTMLAAQRMLQEHNSKMAKKNSANAGAGKAETTGAPTASSVEIAQARAMASLQGLPKVKRVQGADGKEISPTKLKPEEVIATMALPDRNLASVNANESDPAEEGLSDTSLFFMGLLGLFAGLAVAYGLFMRPQKSIVQLMVPGSGEHFAIRPGSKNGEFVLDIMDIRGKLVKTAGTLRPYSVARAAVLPPDLAARLGAKGNFERFELTAEGHFVRTEKEEGYQVFPFVLADSKKAS
jgi:hypothetical protein